MFAPKDRLQLQNTSKFYINEEPATKGNVVTDLRSIKKQILENQALLEVELPEVNLIVPSDNFNIVILGDSTKDSAMQLLKLH